MASTADSDSYFVFNSISISQSNAIPYRVYRVITVNLYLWRFFKISILRARKSYERISSFYQVARDTSPRTFQCTCDESIWRYEKSR